MANPEGRVMMDEAEAQHAAERYAKMEENLQALRRQNQELMRAFGEQQDLVAAERLRADRRAPTQMQEFANLTAELLAGRQGLAVQLDGMRLNVKVEKPEQYNGDKARDLDTWLFQVHEHLDLSTVPARGHVPYAASLLHGNAALWWREVCEANRRPSNVGRLLQGTTGTISTRGLWAQRTRRLGNDVSIRTGECRGFCVQIPRNLS